LKIVLDTNILLVSISTKSQYHWVFKGLLNEEYILCVTTDILQEYEEIIGIHMGLEAANYVMQIIENSNNVDYITKFFRWNLITVDKDDNKFIDCAIASNAKYLVTNDKHFNILKNVDFPKVELLDIKSFAEVLSKRS